MQFWVYENWTEPHARVHFDNCPHCNYGSGTDKEKGPDNGKWIGPFESYENAKQLAVAFIEEHNCKDRNIDCGKCKPHA